MSAGVEEIGEIFWYTNWQATPKLSKEENIDITSAYFVYTFVGICMASPSWYNKFCRPYGHLESQIAEQPHCAQLSH